MSKSFYEMTAAEMARSGAKKELEGYEKAFAIRDQLKLEEQVAAERRRLERVERCKHTADMFGEER